MLAENFQVWTQWFVPYSFIVNLFTRNSRSLDPILLCAWDTSSSYFVECLKSNIRATCRVDSIRFKGWLSIESWCLIFCHCSLQPEQISKHDQQKYLLPGWFHFATNIHFELLSLYSLFSHNSKALAWSEASCHGDCWRFFKIFASLAPLQIITESCLGTYFRSTIPTQCAVWCTMYSCVCINNAHKYCVHLQLYPQSTHLDFPKVQAFPEMTYWP